MFVLKETTQDYRKATRMVNYAEDEHGLEWPA